MIAFDELIKIVELLVSVVGIVLVIIGLILPFKQSIELNKLNQKEQFEQNKRL